MLPAFLCISSRNAPSCCDPLRLPEKRDASTPRFDAWREKLYKVEMIQFRTLLFCCSIQHLDKSGETSLLVCSCSCLLLLFHWNRTTGNCSCHNQSIKKLHLDDMFWSFPKKMTQILEIVCRPCQEENSLFVPTSVQNKVGMVTLVNSALEPSRSESERPTITEAFFGKHNFEYTFTYLPHDSVYPTIRGATVMPWLHPWEGWL